MEATGPTKPSQETAPPHPPESSAPKSLADKEHGDTAASPDPTSQATNQPEAPTKKRKAKKKKNSGISKRSKASDKNTKRVEQKQAALLVAKEAAAAAADAMEATNDSPTAQEPFPSGDKHLSFPTAGKGLEEKDGADWTWIESAWQTTTAPCPRQRTAPVHC